MNEKKLEVIDALEKQLENNALAVNKLKELLEVFDTDNEDVNDYIKQVMINEYNITSRLLCEMNEIEIQRFNNYTEHSPLSTEQLEAFENFYESIIEQLSIKVKLEDNNVIITCPSVNLHRKKVDGQPFFLSCLNLALIKFSKTEEFKEWQKDIDKMTILFTHEYKKPEKVVDNDNLDVKRIIDCLEIYGYIKSDRGDKLTHIHKGIVTGKRQTTIKLIPYFLV